MKDETLILPLFGGKRHQFGAPPPVKNLRATSRAEIAKAETLGRPIEGVQSQKASIHQPASSHSNSPSETKQFTTTRTAETGEQRRRENGEHDPEREPSDPACGGPPANSGDPYLDGKASAMAATVAMTE